MNLRCRLLGHTWGPPEGDGRSPVRRCTKCGRMKRIGGVPHPDQKQHGHYGDVG
jgi:hypothetical protein